MGVLATLRAVADRVRAFLTHRDPRFPSAERKYIKAHPACFLCRRPATTAHHTYPVHAYRELEMVERLWRPVCKPCHRPYCHAGNWATWVEARALDMIAGLVNAPRRAALDGPFIESVVVRHRLGPKRPTGPAPAPVGGDPGAH